MSSQDYDQMTARYFEQMERLAREQLADAAELIKSFTALAAYKGVLLGPEAFEYIQTTGIVAKAPGIARALLGEVEAERDGLLPFRETARRFPPGARGGGCFSGPDFILMAHPCFRRCMHPLNNWAPRFIDLFWGFDSQDAKKYIALDEDRVKIDVDGPGYFEGSTWYGAPFDEDIGRIKPGIVKLRPPLELASRHISSFFSDAYCLDIKWSDSKGVKTFQALEIKTENVYVEQQGLRLFPARYLHAEFDLAAGHFRHFDGAIQLFTEEEYFSRRDSDFNMTLKNQSHIKARSKKVFKINGVLAQEDWAQFCCHFYADNPLMVEYFSGDYPIHITETLSRISMLASEASPSGIDGGSSTEAA